MFLDLVHIVAFVMDLPTLLIIDANFLSIIENERVESSLLEISYKQ